MSRQTVGPRWCIVTLAALCTKLYSSVSSITISLQFGVVWASFALCGPPRWGQLLRLLHHHPLLFGVVHGLALLYVGHHHVLQLQTQPLTLLNLCVFILQKNFHWGPNVSIWGYLKCSLGGSNVPIWGDLMCQFWGYQMCWGLVNYHRFYLALTRTFVAMMLHNRAGTLFFY